VRGLFEAMTIFPELGSNCPVRGPVEKMILFFSVRGSTCFTSSHKSFTANPRPPKKSLFTASGISSFDTL
jgi:hypothetical protein